MNARPASTNVMTCLISFLLGITAFLVMVAAGAAVEIPGQNPVRETVVPCVVGALYFAFCQFWVAPRGRAGFGAKLPTLVAMIAPLVLLAVFVMDALPITRILLPVSGFLGSLVGAMLVGRVAPTAGLGAQSTGMLDPLRNYRRCLRIAVTILVAVGLLVVAGVIPPLMADSTPGFYARAVAVCLGVTVALGLLAAAVLAYGALRAGAGNLRSRALLGLPAVLALLLALAYGFSSGIRSKSPGLWTASVVLMICAISDLLVTALVTAASVIADRASAIGGGIAKDPPLAVG